MHNSNTNDRCIYVTLSLPQQQAGGIVHWHVRIYSRRNQMTNRWLVETLLETPKSILLKISFEIDPELNHNMHHNLRKETNQ